MTVGNLLFGIFIGIGIALIALLAAALIVGDVEREKKTAACVSVGGVMLERTRAIGKVKEYRYTCVKADIIINVGE